VAVGSETLEVLAVPGHSPGGLAFYSATGGFVFVGDSLFRGAIGRTDLAGGDYDTLVDSVKSKLFTLPDGTLVLPGHGPATKISMEKASNPYLR
jgi:glyoxylase-like metal-dependent hydrolase (beta-lactamase superfamily II)